jgi:hypothetical protein
MASGKSTHKVLREDGTPVSFGRLSYNKDGEPLRRQDPKQRMHKKERIKQRRKGAQDE